MIFNPMILKKFQKPLTAYSQELCAVGAANTVGKSDNWKMKNTRYNASSAAVVRRIEISGITFFFKKNSLQPSYDIKGLSLRIQLLISPNRYAPTGKLQMIRKK